MLLRALAVWCLLLVIAVINGGVREGWLVPVFGRGSGHIISTLTLSAAIFAVTWLTIRWLAPAGPREAFLIGGVWVVLVLAFEFLAGHWLFGHPWSRLLADYNLLRGRIWILVLITTASAPYFTAHLRQFWISVR